MRLWESLALVLLVSCGGPRTQGWQHQRAEQLVERIVTICVAGHRYGAVVGSDESVFPLFNARGLPQACEVAP